MIFTETMNGRSGVTDHRKLAHPATKRGTINALIVSYYKSPEFISLSDSTKATYRREIERLRDEHGHRLVAQMKRAHVVKLLEPLADRTLSPEQSPANATHVAQPRC